MDNDPQKRTHSATLAYLINPVYQNNVLEPVTRINIPPDVNKEDKRFYKKRVQSVTRQLFHKNDYPESIKRLHAEYIRIVIEYLKMSDMQDIIQDEYADIEEADGLRVTGDGQKPDDAKSLANADEVLFNVSPQRTLLNNYVTTKRIKMDRVILPRQRYINLKEPTLRDKGLKKKKK